MISAGGLSSLIAAILRSSVVTAIGGHSLFWGCPAAKEKAARNGRLRDFSALSVV
jgi:hypothetical protein